MKLRRSSPAELICKSNKAVNRVLDQGTTEQNKAATAEGEYLVVKMDRKYSSKEANGKFYALVRKALEEECK